MSWSRSSLKEQPHFFAPIQSKESFLTELSTGTVSTSPLPLTHSVWGYGNRHSTEDIKVKRKCYVNNLLAARITNDHSPSSDTFFSWFSCCETILLLLNSRLLSPCLLTSLLLDLGLLKPQSYDLKFSSVSGVLDCFVLFWHSSEAYQVFLIIYLSAQKKFLELHRKLY